MGRDSFLTAYSVIVCLVLLVLGGHFLLYEEWELPPQPPLEQYWAGRIPFRVEPNQSVAVTYTIIYNRTAYGSKSGPTSLEIGDRDPPANTFEVREYDIGSYNGEVVTENANFTVKVYSPSSELLNEQNKSDHFGISWFIDKPSTYRIVIANLNPTETLEIVGTFQFTRNRFYRPYARFGYVIFSLALVFPLGALIRKLKRH